jgi:hypothetical protein
VHGHYLYRTVQGKIAQLRANWLPQGANGQIPTRLAPSQA